MSDISILLLIAAMGGLMFAGLSFLRAGSTLPKAIKVWIVATVLAFAALLIPWSIGHFDHEADDPYRYGDRPY